MNAYLALSVLDDLLVHGELLVELSCVDCNSHLPNIFLVLDYLFGRQLFCNGLLYSLQHAVFVLDPVQVLVVDFLVFLNLLLELFIDLLPGLAHVLLLPFFIDGFNLALDLFQKEIFSDSGHFFQLVLVGFLSRTLEELLFLSFPKFFLDFVHNLNDSHGQIY